MVEIQLLNKLEKILTSFGVKCYPHQTARGEISLPIIYKGHGFTAILSCIGGNPTEKWKGQYNTTVQRKIREHFQAFLAVDAL